MKTTAIILAAGSGKRMGTAVKKQYLEIGGHPVLFYSVSNFQNSEVDEIVLVASPEDVEEVKKTYMTDSFYKVKKVVEGGKERYNSVYNGLCASEGSDYILIHDGARPFADPELINRCIKEVIKEKACVCAVPSKDTVTIVDDAGYAIDTPDRRLVRSVQTPQCFEYKMIYSAYSKLDVAEKSNQLGGLHITDDAMVAKHYAGAKVKMIDGSYNNIKITTPIDIPVAEAIIGNLGGQI